MLDLMDASLQWSTDARCRGLDAGRFFAKAAKDANEAVKVCTRCPVRSECLDYAIDNELEFGVWGGLTERQRRAYVKRLAADVESVTAEAMNALTA